MEILCFHQIGFDDVFSEALVSTPNLLCHRVGEKVKVPSFQSGNNSLGDEGGRLGDLCQTGSIGHFGGDWPGMHTEDGSALLTKQFALGLRDGISSSVGC